MSPIWLLLEKFRTAKQNLQNFQNTRLSNFKVECEQNCEMKRSVLCKLESGQLESLQQRALGQTSFVSRKLENCGRIQWKKIRTGQVMLNGPFSKMMKFTVPNTHPTVDIRRQTYIGFIRFAKIKCGQNFVNAVREKRVSFEFLDIGTGPCHKQSAIDSGCESLSFKPTLPKFPATSWTSCQ